LAAGAAITGRSSCTQVDMRSGLVPELGVTSIACPVDLMLAPPFRATPPQPWARP